MGHCSGNVSCLWLRVKKGSKGHYWAQNKGQIKGQPYGKYWKCLRDRLSLNSTVSLINHIECILLRKVEVICGLEMLFMNANKEIRRRQYFYNQTSAFLMRSKPAMKAANLARLCLPLPPRPTSNACPPFCRMTRLMRDVCSTAYLQCLTEAVFSASAEVLPKFLPNT